MNQLIGKRDGITLALIIPKLDLSSVLQLALHPRNTRIDVGESTAVSPTDDSRSRKNQNVDTHLRGTMSQSW